MFSLRPVYRRSGTLLYPVYRSRPAFVNYAPPPERMRQTNTKQAKQARRPPPPHDYFRKDKKKGRQSNEMKITEDQAQNEKEAQGRPRSNQLQQLWRQEEQYRRVPLTSRPGALLLCV